MKQMMMMIDVHWMKKKRMKRTLRRLGMMVQNWVYFDGGDCWMVDPPLSPLINKESYHEELIIPPQKGGMIDWKRKNLGDLH